MSRPRYISWLLQAESDLRSAESLAKDSYFAQACFNCQQAAEKAMKALAFFRGADVVKSHSLDRIIQDLNVNGLLTTYALKLDLYYLTTRYPDALPEHGVPAEKFDHAMAKEAIEMAAAFLELTKKELSGG